MKNLTFTLIALFTMFSVQMIAQTTTPTKEFTVSLKETNIAVKAGETKTVEVNINRSKRFEKTNIDLMLSTNLPSGVEVTFTKPADSTQPATMTITASTNAAPFKGTYVLNAKSSTVTKGTMFTLAIDGGNTMPAGE